MACSMSSASEQDEADTNGSSISRSSSNSRIPPLCRPENLQTWLSTCETIHPWCRWKHPTGPIPLRLLDVNTLCIKDFLNTSDGHLRYAALSYVWGSKPQRLKLTQANQKALHLEGAFETTQLSRTIRDAVSVVRMLGERYLWVDTLCIIQDSKDDLGVQIPLVGYIFAKALVTIVAASGEHNDVGLPGINGWQRRTSSGRMQQLPMIESDVIRTEQHPPIQFGVLPYLEDTVWESRGWTYQEKLLSRRCLVFTEELVYWECHCASWSEDVPMKTDTLEQIREHDVRSSYFLSDDHFSREGHAVRSPSRQHHGPCLTHMVPSFTARHLTYDQDASRAFAGILQVLTDLGQYKFFHGIPIRERQFVRCLYWIACGDCGLRHQQEVPTWSWMAWKGSIFMFSDPLADESLNIECYFVKINDHGDRYLERVEENSGEEELHLDYQQIPETVRTYLKANFHLLFWAETAILLVKEDGSITNTLPIEEAVSERETSCAASQVNESTHELAGTQSFFCMRTILWPTEEHINAMIIVRDNGVAYRKGTAEINLNVWMAARPKRELIILG